MGKKEGIWQIIAQNMQGIALCKPENGQENEKSVISCPNYHMGPRGEKGKGVPGEKGKWAQEKKEKGSQEKKEKGPREKKEKGFREKKEKGPRGDKKK